MYGGSIGLYVYAATGNYFLYCNEVFIKSPGESTGRQEVFCII